MHTDLSRIPLNAGQSIWNHAYCANFVSSGAAPELAHITSIHNLAEAGAKFDTFLCCLWVNWVELTSANELD